MTIRKKSTTKEAAFVDGAKADVVTRGKEATERKQPFNLLLPDSLYNRLKEYIERFEEEHGVKPSMTKVIIKGLETELDRAEKKLDALSN